MVTRDSVNVVLEPLREGFQADGADLAIEEATDALVQVRLLVSDQTCLDCIMPADVITRVLETTIRENFPGLGRFVFVDPRP
jgi:hypothetical protein